LAVPYKQLIVITSRSEVIPLSWPFKSTHFLQVRPKHWNLMIFDSHIVVYYLFILGSWRQHTLIPGQRTDPRFMSRHRPNQCLFFRIPQLNLHMLCIIPKNHLGLLQDNWSSPSNSHCWCSPSHSTDSLSSTYHHFVKANTSSIPTIHLLYRFDPTLSNLDNNRPLS
jgi:hypothetical protein